MTNSEMDAYREALIEQESSMSAWHSARFGVDESESVAPAVEVRDSLVPDLDPRVVATIATVREERTMDSYRQREAWVMHPGVEVDLSQPVQ